MRLDGHNAKRCTQQLAKIRRYVEYAHKGYDSVVDLAFLAELNALRLAVEKHVATFTPGHPDCEERVGEL